MTEYITIATLYLEYLAANNQNAAYKCVQSNLGRHNRDSMRHFIDGYVAFGV